ncbi:cation:proton antiporter [uncultured Thiodictyon sp.]|uniref:cation:proton antiporter domain-containing protein n=1 Tax=uncultured Thiodictyon sp. TaxID=1846217 RepID=UPI0025D18B9F|nr:cation:proton antiporter [uncultured Thiodictyon sp.]
MSQNPIIFTFFLVFTGAAILATAALAARQSLLVAYIALGILFGPWGLNLVGSTSPVADSAQVGIMFLLFLLGLDLTPQDLVRSLRRTTLVTLGSTAALLLIGGGIARLVGFTPTASLIVGIAMASSPIAQYIADSLRPVRDFFLVLYFLCGGYPVQSGDGPGRADPCTVTRRRRTPAQATDALRRD